MNAPVIAAVRVPPSAWITSQSIVMVRSPKPFRSVTARSERPIRRWISCVLPPTFPLVDSREDRFCVEAGSIAYSAVSHPRPEFFRKGGTLSSSVAAQITRVCPISIRTDPSEKCRKSRVIRHSRNRFQALPPSLSIAIPLAPYGAF